MERFYSDGLGKLCTLDEGYFQSDSFRVKLKIIMSTELPSQQLVPQFCSTGYYLFFSSSAPFAPPCFTTGNFKTSLNRFTYIPQWIISELSFRNNLHLDNGTKAAPSTRKSSAPSFLIICCPPASTLELSVLFEVTKSIHALGESGWFLPILQTEAQTHTSTSRRRCCKQHS